MDTRNTRAILFANGEIADPAGVSKILLPDDFLVAVDGGLRHIQNLGLTPGLLIGDLDSVSQEDVGQLRAAGVPVRKYPVEKDETDLELALRAVMDMGYRQMRIVAGLGGRLDQTLGNLFLLLLPELAACDVCLDDGTIEAFLIHRQTELEGRAGDTLSLLPMEGPAFGVLTEGLYYPLKSETLFPEHTRGISNVFLGDHARVSLEKGILLCIHTRIMDEKET